MSVWTHVAGIIRYDDLRVGVPVPLLRARYEKALGNTYSYEDPETTWDQCNVPNGSEGSLKWKLTENPSKSSLASYAVAIWGDLRDYDSLDEIRAWFERCVLGKDFMVRDAVLHARVEYGDSRTWLTETDNEGKTQLREVCAERGTTPPVQRKG